MTTHKGPGSPVRTKSRHPIALARVAAGFTQPAIAARLGVSRWTWRRYETGATPIPLTLAMKIPALLPGLSMADLASNQGN